MFLCVASETQIFKKVITVKVIQNYSPMQGTSVAAAPADVLKYF